MNLPGDLEPETLRPLHNYLLLEPEERQLSQRLEVIHEPERNEGGIIGVVRAIGPGKIYDGVYTETEAKVGDRVIVVDSHDHKKIGHMLLCQDMDVAAVLEDDDIVSCNRLLELARNMPVKWPRHKNDELPVGINPHGWCNF